MNLEKTLPDKYLDFIGEFNRTLRPTLLHQENVGNHTSNFVHYLHSKKIAKSIPTSVGWDSGLNHDWGKFHMPEIINAQRKLTDKEFEVVKLHPELGFKILSKYGATSKLVLDAVLYHHEDFTGDKGYPTGLNGTDIPLVARITSLCDVYEALYTKRSYKSEAPYTEVKEIMQGMQYKFDPKLFELFFECMDKLILGKSQNKPVVQLKPPPTPVASLDLMDVPGRAIAT